jgi:hypothetical protein
MGAATHRLRVVVSNAVIQTAPHIVNAYALMEGPLIGARTAKAFAQGGTVCRDYVHRVINQSY